MGFNSGFKGLIETKFTGYLFRLTHKRSMNVCYTLSKVR